MTKPIIVLVHGMGNHTAPDLKTGQRGSFGKEFIDGVNKGFKHFEHLKSESIEDHASLIEIHYNDIFDKIRKDLASNGQEISSHISGTKLAGLPGVITSIINFESKLDQDDVKYTHWLDVALYKTYFGNMVRGHVAKALCDIIGNYNGRRIHIVAHSLGTSVVHDTLHQLYSGDYKEDDGIIDISTVTHKLDSVWMVANVSKLMATVLPVRDPYTSLVRPSTSKSGVCRTMYNVHHQLDPFMLPVQFIRTKEDSWIPEEYFDHYLDLETKMVTQYDTHAIKQYMEDPVVLGNFVHSVLQIPVTLAQLKKAKESYKNISLEGAASEIKTAYKDLVRGDKGSMKDFFDACSKAYELIKNKADLS